jgi:hypothetical protein
VRSTSPLSSPTTGLRPRSLSSGAAVVVASRVAAQHAKLLALARISSARQETECIRASLTTSARALSFGSLLEKGPRPMMPVPEAGPPPISWTVADAPSGITDGDWLVFIAGIVIGALTIVVPILIAWRQRIFETRTRAARRHAKEQRHRTEQQQEARLARREVWRAEYEEIRELFKLGEDIAYHVRNHGPYQAAELTDLRLHEFIMKAEQLASRGVDALREPLLKLAALGGQIAQATVPDAIELAAIHGAVGHASGGAKPAKPHAAHRLAVRQDRAARELADEIGQGWQTLRLEWGSQ